MGVHVRGCQGVQGRPPILYPRGVTTEEAKLRSLARHSKPTFTRLLTRLAHYDRARYVNCIQNGLHECHEPAI
jgi:hypothetical protein